MAEAVATGELPSWVSRHLSLCPACRKGLAHVVSRASPLDEAGQALAHQIAFVARVRGLAREVAALQAAAPGEPVLLAPLCAAPPHPRPDPMLRSALLALAVAVTCTILSLHLLLPGR